MLQGMLIKLILKRSFEETSFTQRTVCFPAKSELFFEQIDFQNNANYVCLRKNSFAAPVYLNTLIC